MKENPYSKMIEIMEKHGATSNPPSIQIAEIIEPQPNLIIKVNDLQIDKVNLLLSDHLNIRAEDIGAIFAVLPVEDRQLYIILARLKEA